nr:immunity 52 family protein [Hyalangium gracile]
MLTAPVMAGVLRAMAMAWDPEWGVATSEAHRDSVTDKAKPGTFVGWVMYFSRLRGTVPPLPAPVRIEPVEDQGTLVILTPERFTASNPEHVALAARVHELLARAGLLGPLKPWSTG